MIKKQNKQFSSIKNVLSDTAKRYKLESSLYKYQILSHWEEIIAKFLEGAEGKTKAVDFKNGTLTVACLSSELAYEIKLLAHRIIVAMNEILGKFIVRALHVES